jgi:AraC family transcriptional regulator, ethanolamine operon transcriptional activator
MSCQAIQIARFSDPEELLAALPGVTLRAVPLRAGGFDVSLMSLNFGDIVLQTGECSPAIIMAESNDTTAVVQLPFEGLETFLLNGRLAPSCPVGLYGPGGTLERASSQRTRHAALFLPADAAEALLSPPTSLPLLRPGAQGLLQAPPHLWKRVIDLTRAATATAMVDPLIFEAEQARRSLRASLLHGVHELISGPEKGEAPRSVRASPARHRIIRAADDYLQANPAHPIYTDDLRDAVGVSTARLAEVFRVTFGVSPHRFLKLRRLAMVRAALLRARGGDCPPPFVRTVALMYGFWHFGQFAREYKAVYGETPSATLARAHGAT